jgi:hypothetical protein
MSKTLALFTNITDSVSADQRPRLRAFVRPFVLGIVVNPVAIAP